jgi:hypothetical protein
MKAWIIKTAIIVAGLAGGYLYYKLVGCQSGTCPITANPLPSTLYGGMGGAVIAFIKPSKREN